MQFERAHNGNGKIFGETSHVSRDSFIDRVSYVKDADVWRSELHVSKAENAHLRNAVLEYSEVENAEITESRVIRSKVTGGSMLGAYIERSRISDNARIVGAKAIDSAVRDNAIVEGDAIVKGITVHSRMRLGTGVWLTPPRYADLMEPEICELGITESTDGQVYVGCTRKPIADWMRKPRLWINTLGWPDELGQRLYRLLESWRDTPDGKHI